ncbi:glycoside hydrolase family 16 protein [Pelagicoccus sp. SDUM812002]|uniref:glycoside hydrolase family 16 protein n=1 Tax=Pelagicoccus sp. SDUM812002 TaxID=3041266 RepID=UPI00280FA938|nr:glycoside hydrolase family 16 protein [Pelagicoccus sp. SDUM812002]MDQ8187289.1 glycoside hydrolase family 16 protein [Pelagicoccus sp. SDUM812002]
MKATSFSLLLPASLLLVNTLTQASEKAASSQGWQLVWSDEFEADGLPNPDKWNYDVGGHGWGNEELQYYTDEKLENARVEDGHLIIEAHKEERESSAYTSARLVTRETQAWTYGRFEIRARLPEGLGTWPAIWMLPVDWDLGSGSWPDVGELDIMEHVGYDVGTVHASAHSKNYQWQAGTQKTGTISVPDAAEEFHTYAFEWTEDEVKAFVDDKLYFTFSNENSGWESWPYQRDYYLLLNVAVGGLWGAAKGIDEDCFPQRMEVDYVRVYQKN